jgi:hypothetical protein
VRAGNRVAGEVIQRYGCSFPTSEEEIENFKKKIRNDLTKL